MPWRILCVWVDRLAEAHEKHHDLSLLAELDWLHSLKVLVAPGFKVKCTTVLFYISKPVLRNEYPYSIQTSFQGVSFRQSRSFEPPGMETGPIPTPGVAQLHHSIPLTPKRKNKKIKRFLIAIMSPEKQYKAVIRCRNNCKSMIPQSNHSTYLSGS